MGRFLRMWALALTAVLLAGTASAAASAEIVRAFLQGETLYAYVSFDGVERPLTQAEAKVGGQSFPAAGRLETVQQAGYPITYLLLIDNSNSMPPFREETVAFARGLAGGGGENTRFLIATFGDTFALRSEEVEASALEEEIGKIPFDETVTRLHSGIDSALSCLEALPRRGNELQCLIVITDAVQYDPAGGVPYETLRQRVEDSGVMLHSLGFGDDAAALERLGAIVEASGGCHQTAGADLSAEEAAARLTAVNGALSVLSFDLGGCAAGEGVQTVSVTFAAGGEIVCRAQTEVDLTALEEAAEVGEAVPPAAEPDPSGETEGSSDETAPPAGAEAAGQGAPSEGTPAGAGVLLQDWRVWAAGAAGAALLIAVILRRRKKREAGGDAAHRAPAASEPMPMSGGVYVRAEALRGEFAPGLWELTLTGEALIGQDDSCAVRPIDPAAVPFHARVFLREGMVCLEDLQGGTLVNGRPMETPVQLRSGDEIAIGAAAFRLLF